MKNLSKIIRKKLKGQLSLLAVLFFAFSFVLVSCSSNNDDNVIIDDQTEDIAGKWIGFYDQVITGPNDTPCDAIYFDIDNSGNIKILSFLDSEIAAGHLGTYSYEGEELTLNLTHDWAEMLNNEDYLNWVSEPFTGTVYASVSSDGNTLTAGESASEAWTMHKIETTNLDDAFLGKWYDSDNGELDINSTNTYEYDQTDYFESGKISQFETVDGNTYLFVNMTNTWDVNDGNAPNCDSYFVARVELNQNNDELTLYMGDTALTYTRQTDDISSITGAWIGFYDQVITGPNDRDCNAIFMDIDNSGNIKILSFFDGRPVTGNLGTYSYEGVDLTLEITHDWMGGLNGESFFNWIEEPFEGTVYASVSPDGNTLTAGESASEAWTMHKIEITDLDNDFIGTWEGNFNEVLEIISPNSFGYYDDSATEYSFSGNINQFEYVDGNKYIIMNITYLSEINDDNQPNCDGYYVPRVELNQNNEELTLFFGDSGNTFTLQTDI